MLPPMSFPSAPTTPNRLALVHIKLLILKEMQRGHSVKDFIDIVNLFRKNEKFILIELIIFEKTS